MTDNKALTDEELAATAGMPPMVAIGYLNAMRNKPWEDARAMFDKVGEQAHQGDPIKKARVEHFNEMFIDRLKTQGTS